MNSSRIYKHIVVGSGVAGSLVANRLTSRGESVLLMEAGDDFDRGDSIVKSIFKYYWNAGLLPMLGPFNAPFGQAKVVGGGSVVNGALVWRLPNKVRSVWARELPNSVYDSTEWADIENSLLAEYGVSDKQDSYTVGNEASKRLSKAARENGFQVVPVPRATNDCKNINRCGSGCPNGSKNDGVKIALKGNEYLSISKQSIVKKIVRKKNLWQVIYQHNDQVLKAYASKVILSAGATESANILRRSKLSTNAGNYFKFHLNFKLAAKFSQKLNPSFGTILSDQVQEYMDDGILMMSTNCRHAYLASGLSHLNPRDIKRYMSNYSNMGLYTVMIEPNVKAKVRSFLGQTICFWNWTQGSFIKAKKGITDLASLLFDAGAEEVVLPVNSTYAIANNKNEVSRILKKIKAKDLLGVSVHGMSACRMGLDEDSSTVNLQGKVWGVDDLYVMDSSILPGSIGESPQGAILTTVEMLLEKLQKEL